jgi:hypothetical protein
MGPGGQAETEPPLGSSPTLPALCLLAVPATRDTRRDVHATNHATPVQSAIIKSACQQFQTVPPVGVEPTLGGF